ncbi:hypothetical protein VNO77_01963 [Canavalia gladiata]|uniref:Uncharacterized protein n=1 Tax=Canavalia gladiata TaxID=3824 RepID=A0AAN9R5P1_CANGL
MDVSGKDSVNWVTQSWNRGLSWEVFAIHGGHRYPGTSSYTQFELEMMKRNETDLYKNRVKSYFSQGLIDPILPS